MLVIGLIIFLLIGGAAGYYFFLRPAPAMKFLVVGSYEDEVGIAGVVDYQPAEKRLSLQIMPASGDLEVADVDGYFQVDGGAFIQLVDALGGVRLNVDEEMAYRDAHGEIYFQLDPGWQTLDGEAALYYIRYLGPGEEEGQRLARQEAFLNALLSQAARKENIDRLPELVRLARETLKTDLGADRLLQVGKVLLNRGWEEVELQVLN
ncbi:MAG: LCP family protein [Limnochordia bacterium]